MRDYSAPSSCKSVKGPSMGNPVLHLFSGINFSTRRFLVRRGGVSCLTQAATLLQLRTAKPLTLSLFNVFNWLRRHMTMADRDTLPKSWVRPGRRLSFPLAKYPSQHQAGALCHLAPRHRPRRSMDVPGYSPHRWSNPGLNGEHSPQYPSAQDHQRGALYGTEQD